MSKVSKRSLKTTKSKFDLWLPWIGGAVVTVIGILVIIAVANQTQSDAAIEGLLTYGSPVQEHTSDPVTYEQTPPVGGPHDPVWQNCGVYDQPIRSENAVHALEHGAVWITYRPDLAAEEIATLRELARGRRYLVLSPYPELPTAVAASAWGVQVQVDSAADERLSTFISRYMQGPQTPEPGATCSGGIGTPIG